jgi:GT2 family glycosyltransferase
MPDMAQGRIHPEVTVVIVTYKSAALTIRSLSSVSGEREQYGDTLRAVVVDNASGDMPEIVEAVNRNGWSQWVSLVSAPRNGGFAYGTNLGMQQAYAVGRPDFICLLNPDTQLRSDAIGSLVRFLEARPEVGIAGSSFETGDGADWPFAFRFPSLYSEIDSGVKSALVSRLLRRWAVPVTMTKKAQPIDWVCGASMMIRRDVLSAVGGLDENYFLYFEETDFCRRARNAGFSTWYVPDSRVMHVGGQSTHFDPGGTERRFPSHWFESRRRYFAVTYGIPRATAIDACAILAHLLGRLKAFITLRPKGAAKRYIRDLIHHSVLWSANRTFPAARCFVLAALPVRHGTADGVEISASRQRNAAIS